MDKAYLLGLKKLEDWLIKSRLLLEEAVTATERKNAMLFAPLTTHQVVINWLRGLAPYDQPPTLPEVETALTAYGLTMPSPAPANIAEQFAQWIQSTYAKKLDEQALFTVPQPPQKTIGNMTGLELGQAIVAAMQGKTTTSVAHPGGKTTLKEDEPEIPAGQAIYLIGSTELHEGQPAKISGTYFGLDPNQVRIHLAGGNALASSIEGNGRVVNFVVPAGIKAGNLAVNAQGIMSAVAPYTVPPDPSTRPAAPKVVPENQALHFQGGKSVLTPGKVYRIVGTYFGTDPKAVDIVLEGNATQGDLLMNSGTVLQFVAPEGIENGDLYITVGDKVSALLPYKVAEASAPKKNHDKPDEEKQWALGYWEGDVYVFKPGMHPVSKLERKESK